MAQSGRTQMIRLDWNDLSEKKDSPSPVIMVRGNDQQMWGGARMTTLIT